MLLEDFGKEKKSNTSPQIAPFVHSQVKKSLT